MLCPGYGEMDVSDEIKNLEKTVKKHLKVKIHGSITTSNFKKPYLSKVLVKHSKKFQRTNVFIGSHGGKDGKIALHGR